MKDWERMRYKVKRTVTKTVPQINEMKLCNFCFELEKKKNVRLVMHNAIPKFCFDNTVKAVKIPASKKLLRNNKPIVNSESSIESMTGERKLICEGPHQRKINEEINDIKIFCETQ